MTSAAVSELSSNEEEFIKTIKNLETFIELEERLLTNCASQYFPNPNKTILVQVCRLGFTKVIDIILERVLLQQMTEEFASVLWKTAANGGNVQIFEQLLKKLNHYDPDYNCRKLKLIPGLMQCLIEKVNCPKHFNENWTKIDHEKCLVLLIEKMKTEKYMINDDDRGCFNEMLYYAAESGCDDIVKGFLELGVSLADSVVAIEALEPDYLENYLDQCIRGEKADKPHPVFGFHYSRSSSLAVTLDYTSLIPTSKCFIPETELIYQLTKYRKLKHLLLHPVLIGLLLKKWETIQFIFFLNLAIYTIFTCTLIAYICIGYYIDDKLYIYGLFRLCHSLIFWTLICFFALLLLREVLQLSISPKKYFTNWENYVEILTMLIFVITILIDSISKSLRNQMYAILVPLVMFEFMLLLSKHPKLIFMLMFQRAAFHFIKLFLWFLPLFIGFPISFHMLFSKAEQSPEYQQNINKTSEPFNNSKNEDNATEFNNLGTSLFKTFIMLTGEYDANSINFDMHPFTSRPIFIVFILLCSIVLVSLLNGLAVSDIQTIRNDTELIYYKHLTQYIHDVEIIVLLINRLKNKPPPLMKQILKCLSTMFKNTFIFNHGKKRNKCRLEAAHPNTKLRTKKTKGSSSPEYFELQSMLMLGSLQNSMSENFPLVTLSKPLMQKIFAIFRSRRNKMKIKEEKVMFEILLNQFACMEKKLDKAVAQLARLNRQVPESSRP